MEAGLMSSESKSEATTVDEAPRPPLGPVTTALLIGEGLHLAFLFFLALLWLCVEAARPSLAAMQCWVD